MKRRRSTASAMSKAKSTALGSSKGEPMRLPLVVDEASTQVRPGVVLVDGCQDVGRITGKALVKEPCSFPRMAELSLDESLSEEKRQDVDFNDRFPNEILLQIFKYTWHPVHCWEAAQVCKRWCILQACIQLQKRSHYDSGRYPCIGLKKADRLGRADRLDRESYCDASGKVLKFQNVESEWRLAMDFLKSCKRHIHSLEIKDCSHVSVRGYQLISGFASNLKSIKLESCNTMDDPSFDAILDRCCLLRSIHLSMVPRLALRNMERKAPKLQELLVYGCPLVTTTTVISILKGCPNLRILCLSAMGVSHDWNESNVAEVPSLRLQNLELTNTPAVTDGFLRALSKSLSNLRKLDLTNCPSLSDEGFKAMNTHCGDRLQKLVVSRCPRISDKSVRALALVAANLQDLSLARTDVSDDGVRALMESKVVVSTLRHLSLARCLKVTDAGLQHIVSRQKQLVSFKVLDVQSCPQVSAFGLQALRTSMNEKPWKLVSEKTNVTTSE